MDDAEIGIRDKVMARNHRHADLQDRIGVGMSAPVFERGRAASETDCIVRFVGVSKSFDGSKRVVDDLNLKIRRGEFLTMLGPSGSGKTTSLMMLAGFEGVSSGDILIDGRSMLGVPPYRRNIGMVFQNYALFPHLTIAENLGFPLLARRMPRNDIRDRVRRSLDMVQLSGMGERRPAQLSGGQQQRVAVARALIYQPSLVLMDEPLGALDKQLREQMQLKLKRIHARLGVTFVYVTHDQTEALMISDRIAVFDQGRIRQLASPAQLYEAPESVFVAQFLGETNCLGGTVVETGQSSCRAVLETGDIVLAAPTVGLRAGDRTVVCVRPEWVQLAAMRHDGPNQFRAEVLERIYLGDHLRLRLRACGSDNFLVKLHRNSPMPELRVGESCFVRWQQDDCRALPASSGANNAV
ncbi:MAG TPA: ABC transporter ATP-binding protein [Dongiaceae bacterium]|nr:ABC transporter ATP-binding protein [Dongiaceae bacterium]